MCPPLLSPLLSALGLGLRLGLELGHRDRQWRRLLLLAMAASGAHRRARPQRRTAPAPAEAATAPLRMWPRRRCQSMAVTPMLRLRLRRRCSLSLLMTMLPMLRLAQALPLLPGIYGMQLRSHGRLQPMLRQSCRRHRRPHRSVQMATSVTLRPPPSASAPMVMLLLMLMTRSSRQASWTLHRHPLQRLRITCLALCLAPAASMWRRATPAPWRLQLQGRCRPSSRHGLLQLAC